ncbi:MAG: RNA polymerase factor sigma-54 [Pseudomonadota bacterium]
MALSAGLKLKLGQKLKLAPQLRQAIELLQLNRLELRDHIEQALESNPLLDLESEGEDAFSIDAEVDREPLESIDRMDEELDRAEPDVADWNDLPEGFSEVADAPDYDRFISDPNQDSLTAHLLWQANLAGFNTQDEAIAKAIIYALDEDGYLHDDLTDLRASLAPEYLVSVDEVCAVLERIQHFEPVGIAARNLAECLLIQIRALPSDATWKGLAELLIDRHLEELGRLDTTTLSKRTGIAPDQIESALRVVRKLDPRPGLRFGRDDQNYIVPDAYIHEDEDGWRVTLNRDHEPGLKINQAYAELMKTTRGQDRDYLKKCLQEAQWLISSLDLRNNTLRSVTEAVVRIQTDFLHHGEIAMRPLLQKELAEIVDVHESTVSRATTGKYVHTPRGTFELKHFFSVAIPTVSGQPIAATAVRARLQALIREEQPGKPYSDQALTDALGADGLMLSRRTVAKYREQLGIPGSSKRRRMALV